MTKEELQARVDSMLFYHRIELPHGIVTPGWAPNFPEHVRLPADLTGKRVLDIGAYDGYWSFECLKRGAAHVTAIDNFTDTIHQGEKRSWAQFDLCAEALGYGADRIHRYEGNVYSLEHDSWVLNSRFDLVLFLGVIYHLKHPMLALERIMGTMNHGALLIVESHICDDYSPYVQGGRGDDMVLEFFPDNQLGGNGTNWFAPTLRCIQNMMRVAGFERIEGWKIERPSNLSETRGYAHGYAPK